MLLGLGGRARSAFALILLGDEYLLGSLRLSVQRALFSRVSAAATLSALSRQDSPAYLNWKKKDTHFCYRPGEQMSGCLRSWVAKTKQRRRRLKKKGHDAHDTNACAAATQA